MKLSEELSWRGFINQSTFRDIDELDRTKQVLYFGVDPSADSLTVGNLAPLIMVDHFLKAGHKVFLLIGGATGLIGDPDGLSKKRELKDMEVISQNRQKIKLQLKKLFEDRVTIVDNYDWFKDIRFIDFLRDFGYFIPLRTMLSREFVQSRINDQNNGLSYAEFSYSLIQGYDFYYLNHKYAVNLQLAGADQWGNAIAGVDIIRRVAQKEVNVLTMPLIINKATGVKFGKSEDGAIWLDPQKTSITKFYQFWINVDDLNVLDYLKIYTFITKEEFDQLLKQFKKDPASRLAQRTLANLITTYLYGSEKALIAQNVTDYLTNKKDISLINQQTLTELQNEIGSIQINHQIKTIDLLVEIGFCKSKAEARKLIQDGGVYLNNNRFNHDHLGPEDFSGKYALIRKGKSLNESFLIYTK